MIKIKLSSPWWPNGFFNHVKSGSTRLVIAHRSFIIAGWHYIVFKLYWRDKMHKKEMALVANKQNSVILQFLGSLKLCPWYELPLEKSFASWIFNIPKNLLFVSPWAVQKSPADLNHKSLPLWEFLRSPAIAFYGLIDFEIQMSWLNADFFTKTNSK